MQTLPAVLAKSRSNTKNSDSKAKPLDWEAEAKKLQNLLDAANKQVAELKEIARKSDQLQDKIAAGRQVMYRSENPKYSFPIPIGAHPPSWYEDQMNSWRCAPNPPPFIDRVQALYSLLWNCYKSVTGQKPFVTLFTAAPGTGKTRLLVEWVIQVFQHPCIVGSFLTQDNPDAPLNFGIATDIQEQIRSSLKSTNAVTASKARFMLQLYRAAKQCSAITTIASNSLLQNLAMKKVFSSQDATQICRIIFIQALQTRFGGHLLPNRLAIPSGAPDMNYWKGVSTAQLLDYFMDLVQKNSPYVPLLNTDTEPSGQILFINIDEIQEFVDKPSVQDNKNLAFEVAREFASIKSPHYSLVINMAGIYMTDLSVFKDQHYFFLQSSLPLDPLIKTEYLNQACQIIYNKSLFGSDQSAQNTLTKKHSTQLHQLWIACCGHPRSIEYFVKRAVLFGDKEYFSPQDISIICRDIGVYRSFLTVKKLFTPDIPDNTWNKLLIDFVFCKPKSPDDELFNGVKYSQLEAKFYIIPMQFTTVEQNDKQPMRYYTMPFFQYSQEILNQISQFQGEISNSSTAGVNFKHFPIRIEDAINVHCPSLIEGMTPNVEQHDPTVAGNLLEQATATSLWLQYLAASDLAYDQLIPLGSVIGSVKPGVSDDLYAKWKGVVQLTSQGLCLVGEKKEAHPNFKLYGEFLAANGLIAINTASSQYADVVAPLYDGNGIFKRLLCIQCCNVEERHRTTMPSAVYAQAKWMMGKQFDPLYVLLSPNMDNALLSTRMLRNHNQAVLKQPATKAKLAHFQQWEAEKSIQVSDGTELLSPWFLKTFTEAMKFFQHFPTEQTTANDE